jgi:hypothetical protein
MEKCQTLKVLQLQDLGMDENDCCVLGTYSRPGIDIELICCRITGAAAEALAEVLGRNQGPTKLHILQPKHWQRSLDAIRGRPNFIYVIWTIPFSRMDCAESVV